MEGRALRCHMDREPFDPDHARRAGRGGGGHADRGAGREPEGARVRAWRAREATPMMDAMDAKPFGAILAGGRNVRYGAPKALAELVGERIIDRVRRALEPIAPDLILIANDAEVYAPVGLPMRPDLRPGLGALGGVLTALTWAREAG